MFSHNCEVALLSAKPILRVMGPEGDVDEEDGTGACIAFGMWAVLCQVMLGMLADSGDDSI